MGYCLGGKQNGKSGIREWEAERYDMQKFRKLVSIDKVALIPEAREQLRRYAEEVVLFEDIPRSEEEIFRRIGDADAVLLSANSQLRRAVMERVPQLRYVGMCCSLYSEESANVDIPYARSRGITVNGIRDYGDHGVTEYVIYQLVKLLHGYDGRMRYSLPRELTGLRVGFVGLGASGTMTAQALRHLGAEIRYFARSRKPEREAEGMHYEPLRELLSEAEVVITALNKNVILLHEAEFAALGNGKIMFNTSIGPAAEAGPLRTWLQKRENIFCTDTEAALGEEAAELLKYENVYCMRQSAGMTEQAYRLLSEKVLRNIREYLREGTT